MEFEADRHRVLLFLFLSRMLNIVVFSCPEWQHFEQESHTRQKLLVVDPRSHESSGTDLSTLPFWRASVDMSSLDIWSKIRENACRRDQS
jgi:hypothetical protein